MLKNPKQLCTGQLDPAQEMFPLIQLVTLIKKMLSNQLLKIPSCLLSLTREKQTDERHAPMAEGPVPVGEGPAGGAEIRRGCHTPWLWIQMRGTAVGVALLLRAQPLPSGFPRGLCGQPIYTIASESSISGGCRLAIDWCFFNPFNK